MAGRYLPPHWREWLRGALGGLLGIGLTAAICRALLEGDPALPWLIAPMGASTVLLFAVPASPFAQPWSVLGGHLAAGAIGLSLHGLGFDAPLTAALAVALAIAAMGLLRCLHPPAGGTAVLTALASPTIAAAGWRFLAAPIGLNLICLLVLAAGFHRLTGHTYPHHARLAATNAPLPYDTATLDAVLDEWDEVLEIDRADLDAVIRAVLARSAA